MKKLSKEPSGRLFGVLISHWNSLIPIGNG